MDRLFFKPSRFRKRGEKFETPSGMGGTFTIEFIAKTDDGKFIFLRMPTSTGWPASAYTFTEDKLAKEVFQSIPNKFERCVMYETFRKKYERMLANPHIERVEKNW